MAYALRSRRVRHARCRATSENGRDRSSGSRSGELSKEVRVLALGGLLDRGRPRVCPAQYPPPKVPDLQERSGLVMRFAGVPEHLPPDPRRDNFYNTRYADRGLVKHVNGVKDQGLYGFGWKSACTESVYPFFYGSPGTGKVDPSCLPWQHRSLRFFQGLRIPSGLSECIIKWAATYPSTISIPSPRDLAPTRTRSISTGARGDEPAIHVPASLLKNLDSPGNPATRGGPVSTTKCDLD